MWIRLLCLLVGHRRRELTCIQAPHCWFCPRCTKVRHQR